MPNSNCPTCKGLGGYPNCPICHNADPAKEKADDPLAPTAGSASLIANTNQDEIDWSFFAGKFEKKYGFSPCRRDTGHQEYYHWFTVGAHAEFMGRLNGAQNAELTHPESKP